jgi:hypothetical protein
MLSQMKFPPLPVAANADVLVVDATVAFDYPGLVMLDHLGRLPRSRESALAVLAVSRWSCADAGWPLPL